MANKINPLVLSYPNFVLGQIINPDEANQNNSDITNKVNEFIVNVEEANTLSESADTKADTAISTANNAENVANTKGDLAIDTANNAVTKSNDAISIANTKGDDAISIANDAVTKATDVETDYNTLKPELEQAVSDANSAVENIGDIIDGTIFETVGSTVATGKFTAITDGVTTFSIPSEHYNPNYDYLELSYCGVRLEENKNYTITDRDVTLLFSLNTGEEVSFLARKYNIVDPTLTDGSFIMDGTILKSKLDVELQNEIDAKLVQSDIIPLQLDNQHTKQHNTSQDKEIAYLKLKQQANDRIENGTTFADDMGDNIFGATFDDVNSTNIVKRDGAMLMVGEGADNFDVQDATVTPNAYDTSGNGGRKLVRLDNGWLVAGVYNSADMRIELYKTETGDWSDSTRVCYFYNTAINGDFAIVEKGNSVYINYIRGANSNWYTHSKVIDIITQTDIDMHTNTPFLDYQEGIDSCSLTINENKTELHACWSSKNSTYPDSFNIRYAKGVINGDGSVTWGSIEQVTTEDTDDITKPSIASLGGSKLIIVWAYKNSVRYKIYDGSNWSSGTVGEVRYGKLIYESGSYTQSSPSAIFVPSEINGLEQGRIWVAWHGKDSVDSNVNNIRVSYSDDGGITWSAMEKLTNGNSENQYYPSVTANKDGKVYVIWGGYFSSTYQVSQKIYYNGISWSNREVAVDSMSAHKNNPSTLFDTTFNLDFTEPLFIYQDNENSKVGFYGTWQEVIETPSTTGTAIYDLLSTDYVGAFVQKEGSVNVEVYINDVLMDGELEDNEYMFTKSLDSESPVTLRLELSRADTSGGENDKVTRLLGGRS